MNEKLHELLQVEAQFRVDRNRAGREKPAALVLQ